MISFREGWNEKGDSSALGLHGGGARAVEDAARKEQEMKLKLPWRREPELRTIETVLTEREAKVVARMRADRLVRFVTKERILPALLYFVLGFPALMMWGSTQDMRWALLLFTAIAVILLDIWRYDRKKTRWKREELERMKSG